MDKWEREKQMLSQRFTATPAVGPHLQPTPLRQPFFGTFKRPFPAVRTTTASSNRQAPRAQQFPLNQRTCHFAYRCAQCGLRLGASGLVLRGVDLVVCMNVIHTARYVGKKLLAKR